ncbi:hypothetical protein HUS23_07985 [Ectothiorhodospiraceae bacterium 2226]|nr:hypothetical protein HUS23_07985 [Ectothiorhodospiraceae bacterium 2226]
MKNVRVSTMRPLALAMVLAFPAAGASSLAQAEVSGSVDVLSQYVLRGIVNAPENENVAVQAGLEYGHASGMYAGYWASNLGYGEDGAQGVENNLYAGYAGEAGAFGYDLGVLYYAYLNAGDDVDAPEIYASLSYGPFMLGAAYLADDVTWGNRGDIYWTLGYETALPGDFSLGALLGYYTYSDSGDFIPATAESSAFRHFNLTLSRTLGTTGAEMSITGILGGKDRDGVSQDNAVVLGLHYAF